MNPLDLFFCILYDYYEQRRQLNPNVVPWFQAIGLMALSFTFWVMLAGALTITSNLVPAHIKLITIALFFVYFIFGYSLYLTYGRNKKYLGIFSQYKKQFKETPVFRKMLTWSIIIAPILLFFLMVIIRTKR
jgi:uncharacterized membrane protein YozB (DUF420 family)